MTMAISSARAADKEQPLPTGEIHQAVHVLDDPPAQRAADDVADRDTAHEQRGHLGALAGREPQRQIEDHAGVEAGLRQPQQETRQVKLPGLVIKMLSIEIAPTPPSAAR